MKKSDLSLKLTLSIWWSVVWRGALAGGLAGAAMGCIGGAFCGLLGRTDLAPIVGAVLGYLTGLPISVWALRQALLKPHYGYVLSLVRQGD
jgi:hypothetical protein